jgi:hypothetical protein
MATRSQVRVFLSVEGAAGLVSVALDEDAADGAASVPPVFASGAAVASPLPFASFVGDGFAPVLRKSVTYQPEPFKWKPAADTRLTSSDLWQAGQSVSGGSEIFCSTSSSWPQEAHRYS